ncbi:MAG: hypothetical protein N2169_07775, partial [bacterium]|nr:hypothetical protein [bacterium]
MLKYLVIINIFIVIVLFLVGATKSNTFVIKDVLIEGPDDYGLSLSIDASGKVYVLGDSNNGRKSVIYISRFNSDGSVDRTFGSEGKVVFKNIAGGSWDKTYLSCLHVKEDKIYVSGESMNSNSDYDAFVIKLNSNGSLDSTFANGGILLLNNLAGGQWDDFGRAIYFHEKIYLAGKSWNTQKDNGNTDVFVVRINNDGSIDRSFGKDGKVLLNSIAGGDWDDDVFTLQVDNRGKAYIGGTSWNGKGENSGIDGYVIRLNSTGILDESFGKGGTVILKNIVPNSLDTYVYHILVSEYGGIYACGDTWDQIRKTGFIVKLKDDGSFDKNFANNGVCIIDGVASGSGDNLVRKVAVDNKNRLYVIGSSYNGKDSD